MEPDIQKAKDLLAQLPSSVEKGEAMRLLDELERADSGDEETVARLERIEKAAELSREERFLFRWLPWFSVVLGCYAIYTGLFAISAEEFCHRSRAGSIVCSLGLKAQLEGLVVATIGLILFLPASPSGQWRGVLYWLLGLCLALGVYGSLLVWLI